MCLWRIFPNGYNKYYWQKHGHRNACQHGILLDKSMTLYSYDKWFGGTGAYFHKITSFGLFDRNDIVSALCRVLNCAQMHSLSFFNKSHASGFLVIISMRSDMKLLLCFTTVQQVTLKLTATHLLLLVQVTLANLGTKQIIIFHDNLPWCHLYISSFNVPKKCQISHKHNTPVTNWSLCVQL